MEHDEEWVEPEPSLGLVLDSGRGSLPFALLHGEPLVACAAWALGEAGVTQVDVGTPWSSLVEAGDPVVLHDPLCPMVPASFVAACVAECVATQAVVVAVRPVTDTVRPVDDAGVCGTPVDRDELVSLASPVVLPPPVVAALDGLPTDDLVALVDRLAARWPVVTREAPPEGRRVGSAEDLLVLETLTAP